MSTTLSNRHPADEGRPDAQSGGPDTISLSLWVNGRPATVHIDPSATLAEVLRDGLSLTGTCRVPPRPGSACTAGMYQCDIGLMYCGADSKCHPRPVTGQPCNTSGDETPICLVGQCDTAAASPVCKTGGPGSICLSSADCGPNAICVPSLATGQSYCTAPCI